VEGIGQDKIPGTLDLSVVDEWRYVEDRASLGMARRLTREEGLFVGGSAGLICQVALDVARELTIRTPASSSSCATPASATSPRYSTTSGCARTGCWSRRA
jgi:cysteine synthase